MTSPEQTTAATAPEGPETHVRGSGPTVGLGVALAASLVTLAALDPAAILSDSMPWGTDLTGHVVVSWADAADVTKVLPGSWSDVMFGGYPINQLYPWLPAFVAAVLSWVMPLAVAFKIAVAAPLVLLPLGTYVSGRWARLPDPAAAALAVGTLPFLFSDGCATCGGTIASTVNGEFAFAWGVLFAVLALGAIDRLTRTGRGALGAAALAAAAALSHPVPSLWLLVGAFVIAVAREAWRPAVRRAFGLSLLLALLIAASWWIPFAVRRPWMPLLGFERRTDFASLLLPGAPLVEGLVLAAAVAGAIWAMRRRSWFLVAVLVQTGVALLAFLRLGDGQLYNLRVLPFVELGRWLLAAVGAWWLLSALLTRIIGAGRATAVREAAPALMLASAILVVGSTWGWWGVVRPATQDQAGEANVLGVSVPITTQSWAASAVLRGFAARPDYPELLSVQALVKVVATRNGCGTMLWDSGSPEDPAGEPFGDMDVMWQSPLWSEGCISPATGVLLDSSASMPAALMTHSLVSQGPVLTVPAVPAYEYDLADKGIERMGQLGIRYYLTHGRQPAVDAAASKELTLVGEAGPWQMWQVNKATPVVSSPSLPAVVEPPVSDADWITLGTAYYPASTFGDVPLAQSGPTSWPRVAVGELPTSQASGSAGVTDIVSSEGRVSFTVKETGIPVIVRVPDYPGWRVEGADGPYRVTPNLMVVVPTQSQVQLVKDLTAIDWAALVMGLAGLGLLVGLLVHRLLGRRSSTSDEIAEPGAPTA